METLNKAAGGMQRKAHGAQRPRHDMLSGESARNAAMGPHSDSFGVS
jgi:hypothetical protein